MINNLKFLFIGVLALALTSCEKDELESPNAGEKSGYEVSESPEKRSLSVKDMNVLNPAASEINDDDDDESGGKPNGPGSK